MNIPNKLTVGRILLTFVFMIFLFGSGLFSKVAALITFLLASFTDWFDGYLARKYNLMTDFGRFMDPIADKVLVLAAFFAFIELNLVPAWMVVIILLREFVITGIRLNALNRGKVLAARGGGKHKTASQLTAIFVILVFLILREIGFKIQGFWGINVENNFRSLIFVVMLITTVLTIISGAAFLYKNRKLFTGNGK